MSEPMSVRFGVFELDLRTRELRKHGIRLKLQEQPFQVLQALVERPGELVTREDLQRRIWGVGTFVSFDQSLNRAVNKVRETLGDEAETPRFIETLPRRGYRFIAPVDGAPKAGPGPTPEPAQPAAAVHRFYSRFAWVAAGLLAVAGAVLWLAHDRAAPPPARVVPLTTFSGVETEPAFSPDGKQVAFTWNGEKRDNYDVYVKVVGGATALRLTSDPANDGFAAWSPDGRQIAFFSARDGGGIYLVSPLGGTERKLADLTAEAEAGHAAALTGAFSIRHTVGRLSWSPDGKYLLVPKPHRDVRPETGDGALFLIPVESGGAARQMLSPPRGTWYRDPAFGPDGRSLAFVACTGTTTTARCSLEVIGFKPGLVPSGEPRQITRQSWGFHGIAWMPDGASMIYSGSTSEPNPPLWRVNVRKGKEPERLELAGADAFWPVLDPKGGRLAFSRRLLNLDVWRLEPGRKPTPFLTSSARESSPQYSPDGRHVAFESNRQARRTVWVASADGTGAAEIVNRRNLQNGTPRWSPDSRRLAFDSLEDGRGWDIWVVEASGSLRQLTHGPTDNYMPSWSHDGKSIYFASTRSGRHQIWRVAAEGGTAAQVTRNGGHVAFESPDGKTLYYTLSEVGGEGLYAKQLPDGVEKQVVKDGVASRGFAVFSDGVYYLHGGVGDSHEIRFHEFLGGRTHVIAEIEGRLSLGFAVSPDRKAFLVTKYGDVEADLMLIENFR